MFRNDCFKGFCLLAAMISLSCITMSCSDRTRQEKPMPQKAESKDASTGADDKAQTASPNKSEADPSKANPEFAGDKKRAAPEAAPQEETTAPFDNPKSAALLVKGDAGASVIVEQNGKYAGPGIAPGLNSVIELAPGDYEVYVNKSKRTVMLKAGRKTILLTGTLLVEGKGDYYAPYEGKEARVQGVQPRINSSMPLFAGTYSVVVVDGLQTINLADKAKVVAGQKTVLKR